MKVIILAGGCGSRLWPMSRGRFPKQFIKFQGKEKSLFQETYERGLMLTDATNIYVVTNEQYRFLTEGAIEELALPYVSENIIVEPEAKSTLPAIYAGVMKITENDAIEDSVLVFPSDHNIVDNKGFIRQLQETVSLSKHHLITFGVKPDNPNTGYGYISPGAVIDHGFWVESFKEKPNRENAIAYIDRGYYWNAGIFMFGIDIFREEVKRYAPDIDSAFTSAESLVEAFGRIDHSVSIDYAIMEKSHNVVTIPIDVGWSDMGSFDAFYDIFPKDDNDNIIDVNNIVIDSKNNLIHSYSNKLIATVGVEDLIIIDERDALLVCKKEHSQSVRRVVDTLKAKGDSRSEVHVKDYRPWGHFKILEEESGEYMIRKIVVQPGKIMNYSCHCQRLEHWIIIKGCAQVVVDGLVQVINAGESMTIKNGDNYQIENLEKVTLEMIEVQVGTYLTVEDHPTVE